MMVLFATILSSVVLLWTERVVISHADVITEACKGNRNLQTSSSGNITTPNYPNNYNSSLFCRWTIQASDDKMVQLSFIDFELLSSVNCNVDTLFMVVDNKMLDNKKYCGTNPPSDYSAPPGSEVIVSFYSQGSGGKKGFLIHWILADVVAPTCSSETVISTSSSGNIYTPSFSNKYGPNLQCRWEIQAPNDKVIQLTFVEFYLESGEGCPSDFVIVYVGNEMLGKRKYCGNSPPLDFTAAPGSDVTISFTSNSFSAMKGFHIRWKFADACSSTEYACWDGNCIPKAQHCDGEQQCADSSDEIECSWTSSMDEECGKTSVAPSFPWNYRIFGGSTAAEGSYPWQAMLVYYPVGYVICGASIIAKHWILTAAHCVEQFTAKQLAVVVGRHRLSGSNGEDEIRVSTAIVHSQFNEFSVGYDIALLGLDQAISYTSKIRPICTQAFNTEAIEVPDVGTKCIVTGWGRVYSNLGSNSEYLRQVRVSLLEQSFCERGYGALPVKTLCAGNMENGGTDACTGDSGGPLICLVNKTRLYQIGIVSFGHACGERAFPGIYTDVTAFSDWIRTKIQTASAGASSLAPTQGTETNLPLPPTSISNPGWTTPDPLLYIQTAHPEQNQEPLTTSRNPSVTFSHELSSSASSPMTSHDEFLSTLLVVTFTSCLLKIV